MVMPYFRSETQDEFGNWNYSLEFYDQFMGIYPDIQTAFHLFTQHCTRIVGRFLETGTIEQKKSTERPASVVTEPGLLKILMFSWRQICTPLKSLYLF